MYSSIEPAWYPTYHGDDREEFEENQRQILRDACDEDISDKQREKDLADDLADEEDQLQRRREKDQDDEYFEELAEEQRLGNVLCEACANAVKTEEDALDLPNQDCTRLSCSICMATFEVVSGVVWHIGCGEEARDVPAAACLLLQAEGVSVAAAALVPQPVVFAHILPASEDQGLFSVNCMTCVRPFSVVSAQISHANCIAPPHVLAGDVACSDDECDACSGMAIDMDISVKEEGHDVAVPVPAPMAVVAPAPAPAPVVAPVVAPVAMTGHDVAVDGIAQRLAMRRRSIAFRVKTIHCKRKF